MPRTGRKESSTGFYHVIIRGINQEHIFATNRDKEKMIRYMKEKKEDYVEIYAFCVMSNHLHLLLFGKLKKISAFMRMIETSYALYYNTKKQRNGYVFQNRFKSFPIEDRDYLWHCWHYIHLNPVKAKMVQAAEHYQYSSAREYALGRKGLVDLEALQSYDKEKFYYPVEKLEKNIKNACIYIQDLEEEQEEQKRKIAERWVKEYLHNHPKLEMWEIKELAKERKKMIEEILDLKIMSKKEFCKIIKQF